MRSFSCLCVPLRLKAGRAEPEGTTVTRQRLRKHVPMLTNTHAPIKELLHMVFYMQGVWYQIPLCRRRKVGYSQNL
jgi:hypothetical protein